MSDTQSPVTIPTSPTPSETKDRILGFLNPYEGLETIRANAEIERSDYAFIKGLSLGRGTMITTVNLLIAKLVNELKARNITDFTNEDEFKRFIVGCRFVHPEELGAFAPGLRPVATLRQPAPRSHTGAITHEVGRGVAGVSNQVPPAPHQPSSDETSVNGGTPVGASGTGKPTNKTSKKGKAATR